MKSTIRFDSGNPNLRNILVKLFMTDNCIALRTYDRTHGMRGRFLFDRDRFRAWLEAIPELEDAATREYIRIFHDGTFRDSDCGHVMSAYRNGRNICFEVIWLSTYGDVDVRGFIQRFNVPSAQIRALLDENTSIRLLHRENGRSARISCNPCAAKAVRRICGDKLKRHAFRKAMRDCFGWKDDTVTLSHDGRDDFYFSAEGAWRINGGLILHEGKVKTPHGVYPKLYYSVHT